MTRKFSKRLYLTISILLTVSFLGQAPAHAETISIGAKAFVLDLDPTVSSSDCSRIMHGSCRAGPGATVVQTTTSPLNLATLPPSAFGDTRPSFSALDLK